MKYTDRLLKDFSLGTWNVRTLYRPGALTELTRECDKYIWDVIALQEIRWSGKGMVRGKDYILLYSGSDGPHHFGTGFILKTRLKSAILNLEANSDRLCTLRLKGKFCNITLVNAHTPTEDKTMEEKDDFYDVLEQAYNSTAGHDMKIVLGDFNAQVGKEEAYRPIIGRQPSWGFKWQWRAHGQFCCVQTMSADEHLFPPQEHTQADMEVPWWRHL